ncbi:MAG: hypothetical protein FWD98_06440 [Defluviitaleaceae bacterium]|nr:hypothetical protein [Defluviitaleaceae bacterium]
MYTKLRLKEKTDTRVIYYYSAAEPELITDGEIEYTFETLSFNYLKFATGDPEGIHARLMRKAVWKAVEKENCPEERFFAYG